MVGWERLDAALSERFRRSVNRDNGVSGLLDCISVSRAKIVNTFVIILKVGVLAGEKTQKRVRAGAKKDLRVEIFLTEQRGKR